MPSIYWWMGNWWAGGVASSPVTGVALDERIMQQIVDVLETITVANGYHQNVTVHRPPVGSQEFGASDCPAVSVRRMGKDIRTHLRGAEEFILSVRLICIVENTTSPDPAEAIKNLMGDVKKAVYANRRWHDGTEFLARRTWFTEDGAKEPEIHEETITSTIVFQVLARASQTDYSQVKDI